MLAFDDAFDGHLWVQQHGAAERGSIFTLELAPPRQWLAYSVQIASCASWEIPEIGVGQAVGRHEGFRGSFCTLLEKARRDIERNRGLYGEAAQPEFQKVLSRIDAILDSSCTGGDSNDTISFKVRDPSGLSSLATELEGFVVSRKTFLRSEEENVELGLAPNTLPDLAPGTKQLSSAPEIAELVRRSRCIAALTGAGISVESGIRPFRNPSADEKGSIWGEFDAARLTLPNFNSDPVVAQEWWDMKRKIVKEVNAAIPNPAHVFFSMLEHSGQLSSIVTQNIDSMHQKAGVSNGKVIELHGHMRGLICSDRRTPLNPIPFGDGCCTFSLDESDVTGIDAAYHSEGVPPCPRCGSPLRTETVLFGQPMPDAVMDTAREVVHRADLLLVIGSTLLVAPANELPAMAMRKGIPVVIINFDHTRYDAHATGLVRQKAGAFLQEVMGCLENVPQPFPSAKASSLQQHHPTTPEERKCRKVFAEATQRSREIHTASNIHGVHFFCTALLEPDGDVYLLEKCLDTMQTTSGDVGKMLFSASCDQLAVVALVPDTLTLLLDCREWLRSVVDAIGGETLECSTMRCRAVLRADPQHDIYPLKVRDLGINVAIQFLRSKGLLPVDEDEDWVYGDDDFPLP